VARLIVLLVIAVALVIALVWDQRGRRDARIARLRWAFLHGTLAGYARPANLEPVVHPGGLTFRAPTSWTIDVAERCTEDDPPPGAVRRVHVELLHLEGPGASGTESVTSAMKALETEGDSSLEVLPNGHVLMKALERRRRGKGVVASYVWRLGHARPPRGIEIAIFRLGVPVEAAAEVIAQSDLATLDREVREAAFSD
jgi:hypothetical protein